MYVYVYVYAYVYVYVYIYIYIYIYIYNFLTKNMPAVYCEQGLQYGVPFIKKTNLLFCFLVAWDHFFSFQLIYAGVYI